MLSLLLEAPPRNLQLWPILWSPLLGSLQAWSETSGNKQCQSKVARQSTTLLLTSIGGYGSGTASSEHEGGQDEFHVHFRVRLRSLKLDDSVIM